MSPKAVQDYEYDLIKLKLFDDYKITLQYYYITIWCLYLIVFNQW